MRTTVDRGQEGEERAAAYLKQHGYALVERNFRSPFGEIDIIASENDCLVFVEVKFRNVPSYGTSLESISQEKQKRLIKTAHYYLKKKNAYNRRVRFDVLGIDRSTVKLVKNAFLADE